MAEGPDRVKLDRTLLDLFCCGLRIFNRCLCWRRGDRADVCFKSLVRKTLTELATECLAQTTEHPNSDGLFPRHSLNPYFLNFHDAIHN